MPRCRPVPGERDAIMPLLTQKEIDAQLSDPKFWQNLCVQEKSASPAFQTVPRTAIVEQCANASDQRSGADGRTLHDEVGQFHQCIANVQRYPPAAGLYSTPTAEGICREILQTSWYKFTPWQPWVERTELAAPWLTIALVIAGILLVRKTRNVVILAIVAVGRLVAHSVYAVSAYDVRKIRQRWAEYPRRES